MYTKQLPEMTYIDDLSKQVRHYPVYAHSVQAIAQRRAYKKPVQDFLKLFPEDEIFASRNDLVNRCSELEVIIQEERDSPQEFLRSP